MDGIEYDWDGRQLIADGLASSGGGAIAPDPLPRWHFTQWASGASADRSTPLHGHGHSGFSGFSGYGHAMAGGQRWAAGYRRELSREGGRARPRRR